MRYGHHREMAYLPSCTAAPVAPVGLLRVEEETLVQSSDLFQDLAADNQEGAHEPVGRGLGDTAPRVAPPRAIVQALPSAIVASASPIASRGEGKRRIVCSSDPRAGAGSRLPCRCRSARRASQPAPRECRKRLDVRVEEEHVTAARKPQAPVLAAAKPGSARGTRYRAGARLRCSPASRRSSRCPRRCHWASSSRIADLGDASVIGARAQVGCR